jgi:hypothetical protein
MTISHSSILAAATDPLFLAGAVTVVGFFGARYWQRRSALAYFFVQLFFFAILTGLMLAGGAVPYRPGVSTAAEPTRLFVGVLEVIWWLGAAWLAVGFLRAFVVLGRESGDTKLVQDLLAALIYLAATFGNRRLCFRSAGERVAGDLRRVGDYYRFGAAKLPRRRFFRNRS